MAGQRRRSLVDVDAAGFLDGLEAALTDLRIKSEDELVRMGLDVQNRARSLCPVDTGRLRSSIRSKRGIDRHGVFVEVGTSVNYAPFVEFGTTRMAAQPFMRPALAEAAARWSGGRYAPRLRARARDAQGRFL